MSQLMKMGSLFMSEDELLKKDDDHKKKPGGRGSQWNPARVPPRKTFRRVAIVLVLGVMVYLFISNIPTDLPLRDARRHPFYGSPNDITLARPPPHSPPVDIPITKPWSKTGNKDAESPTVAEYNGPVKFMNLAVSLHAISGTRGGFTSNKNVLFMASSLKSAATLLPMACQMGTELKNYVHFALVSRSEIDMEELRTINGIDDSCHVIFHDARPDLSATSTETRMETSTARALYHINQFMHPQAVIIDCTATEEEFFKRAMKDQAPNLKIPLIEMPERGTKKLEWMTKLDSTSLSAWNRVSIDILIHASPGASGSLIRLLKSLSAADYTSCGIPHLTIELPHTIDLPTENFLETFQWPPAHVYNPSNSRHLSLRHRIPRTTLNEEESSVRFLESFWPTAAHTSHVLVLTPQAELSPSFFHYLKYTLLEYTCSTTAIVEEWNARLLGISLDFPTSYLNATEAFVPPKKKDAQLAETGYSQAAPTSFLWQAPSSNAVLFTGTKWIELHAFVSRYMDTTRNLHSVPPFLSQKVVSKKYPSWLEHALKLARARGYWTLYPSQPIANGLATIHTDLYKPPEEYEAELAKERQSEAEIPLAATPLLEALPEGGVLPPFSQLPLLSWDGSVTTLQALDNDAQDYAARFKNTIGGCEKLSALELIPHKSAKDLFCTNGE